MTRIFRIVFPSARHKRLFLLMAAYTCFIAILIFIRISICQNEVGVPTNYTDLKLTRGLTYAFLGWNLVLAWIPYILALIASSMHRFNYSSIKIGLVAATWLLFLPNAPYIVTDLLHLKPKPPIPMWFDVILIFSAAWVGLLLAFLSIREIHKILEARIESKMRIHVLMLSILALTGYGVWLGRFHRWNSWDIISRPDSLALDIVNSLTKAPVMHQAWSVSGILFIVLAFGYYTMLALMEKKI
jgi:uncharacterized membrane protein